MKQFTHEGSWDIVKLNQYLSEDMVTYITENISPKLTDTGRDKAWWMDNSSGLFNVKSA